MQYYELQEAINQTSSLIFSSEKGNNAHIDRMKEHLEVLLKIQIERAETKLKCSAIL